MELSAKIALAAGIAALVGAGAAGAQAVGQPHVERSGRTYHVAVCPGPAARGFARCHAHVVTDSRGDIFVSNGVSRNNAPAGYNSNSLRAAYGITGVGSSATIVAIVDAYGYPKAASDLAVYRTQMGLPACTTQYGCLTIVNQNGGSTPPKTNTGWDQEQALDLDMVSTMCPDCRIVLVQASSSSNANLAAAENEAVRLDAHVVSNSYGGNENGAQAYEAAYDHPGVAITASAGDSGYGAQFPATSPHVTAVGGTSLYYSGGSRTETVWSGTGSGCSTVFEQEAWQSPSNKNMSNNTLCTMRMETDVSAVADPNTGVSVYGPVRGTTSGWMVFGGTSVAAPLIGGIYGEVGNAVTYGSYPYAHASALHDITSGSNGSCGGTYYCTAVSGYDGPTGLGTPNGDGAF